MTANNTKPMKLFALIFTVIITCQAAAQPLFVTDLLYETAAVSVSPQGAYMVYTEYQSRTGILVRRTDNRDIVARIGTVESIFNPVMTCHGFLNDSIIVVDGFNDLVFYNIHSTAAIDTLEGSYFSTWMTDTSLLAYRRDGGVRTFFEYNVTTSTERPVFTGTSSDRFYSVPHSKYFIRTSLEVRPIVQRKDNLQVVRTLQSVGEDFLVPYAFTEDGSSVYAQIDQSNIGKINLLTGEVSEKRVLLDPDNYDNRFALSRDQQHLVITSPKLISLINLTSGERTSITSNSINEFQYASWLPDSRRILVSSAFTVREHGIDNLQQSILRAIIGDNLSTYVICDAERVAVSALNGAQAFSISLDEDEVTLLLYPPPNDFLSPVFPQRLYGSDTLVSAWGNGLLFYSFCRTPFTEEFVDVSLTLDRNLSISSDKLTVVGQSRITDSVVMYDLRTKNMLGLDISQVGKLYKIRFVSNDDKLVIIGALGAIVYDLVSASSTFFDGVKAGGHSYQQDDVFSSLGDKCALVQSDRSSVLVYRAFPSDPLSFPIENLIQNNLISDASIRADGELISIEQTDGLIRLLRTSDGVEVARRQLPGYFLDFVLLGNIKYDINQRILTWQNWFGEFVVERWPEQPVTVPYAAAASSSPRSGIFVDGHQLVTIDVPASGSISNVEVFDIQGRKRVDFPAYNLNHTNSKLTFSVANLESGVFVVVLQTPRGQLVHKILVRNRQN